MAEAFYAAIYAVGTYLAEAGVTAYVAFYAAEISAVLYFAAALAASSAYSSNQRRRAERQARDAYNASLQDRLVMVPLAGGQRSRVYGKVRNVEGVLFKATRGADSQIYTLVVSVAGHQIAAIDTVYFDDVPVAIDGDGYVTTMPFSGNKREDGYVSAAIVAGANSVTLPFTPVTNSVVVTGRYGDGETATIEIITPTVVGTLITFNSAQAGTGIVSYQYDRSLQSSRVRKYLGGPSQNLSSVLLPLFPSLLTANDKFAGDACLIVDLVFSHDSFPTGVPNISAVIRGASDVLDPRTNTTGYTENPALIARDWAYYQFGGNFTAGTVRAADVIAAANACDVSTVFHAPTGNVTQPLFTCGIVCRTDQDPSQSFDEIVESMAGRSGWSGGVLRMRAGVYRAPVATITEDWLCASDSITVVPEGPVDEGINIVRSTIADTAQGYVVAPAPDVRATAYITLDGRELPQDLIYGGITDISHAQHVSGIILRESRSALTVTLPCNMRAFQLELFDVVNITLPRFGWDNKLFEVSDWRFSIGGGVVLTLRETGSSIYDPDALFSDSDATPNTLLPNPFAVPTPAGLTLASGTAWLLKQDDGTVASRLNVSWTPITDAAVVAGGSIEVRYGLSSVADLAWTSIEVPGGDSQLTITGVQDGEVYIVKLRARNSLVRGQWSKYVVHKIIGKTAPPANVAGLASVLSTTGVRLYWTRLAEADYAETELRLGSTWATSTPLFRGNADTWTWLAPPVGTLNVLAKHYDTSGSQSVTASAIEVVVTAAAALQWADVAGRPKLFRVIARGYSDTESPLGVGLYDGETNTSLSSANSSYQLAVITRSTGAVSSVTQYDVAGTGLTEANRLASDLNSLTSSAQLAVIWTNNDPSANRLLGNLPAAMKRCGASAGVFGSPAFAYRSAYVLIGIGACGEGNGFESYQGDAVFPTRAFCDVSFTLQAGNLIITGSGATPRTLADYSYTGSLDATTDLVLIPRGVVLAGNSATKTSGVAAWDSDVYSRDSFTGGAYVSGSPAQTYAGIMLGLNSDPTTDSSFTSIDYAWYTVDNVLQIYESGISQSIGVVVYAAGDILAVLYDGSKVLYLQNGIVRRSVAAAADLTFFLDTSFYTVGGRLSNIRFGPMSAVTGIGTSQIAAGAATEIRPEYLGSTSGALFKNNLVTIDADTFTPSVSCKAVIGISFDAQTNNSGWDGSYGARGEVAATAGSAVYSNLQALSATRASYAITFSADLTGGQEYSIGLANANNPSGFGNGQNYWNVRVHIELIKR